MLCCPRIDIIEIFDKDVMEDYWYTKRDIVPFCQAVLNRISVIEPPKLQDIASTIAFLCGHDSDREISTPMMGLLFKCWKQRELFHFDVSMSIAKELTRQLDEVE